MRKILLLICLMCSWGIVCTYARNLQTDSLKKHFEVRRTLLHEAKIIEGTVTCLKDERNVWVSIDCSKTKYKKNRPLEDFLSKAYRDEEWERKSLERFNDYFNRIAYKLHMRSTLKSTKHEANYEIIIVPTNVTSAGFTTSTIYVKNISSGDIRATIEIISNDGDSNDEVALGDALSNTGKQFANLLVKELNNKN